MEKCCWTPYLHTLVEEGEDKKKILTTTRLMAATELLDHFVFKRIHGIPANLSGMAEKLPTGISWQY